MEQALVIGASGGIGAALVDALTARGDQVTPVGLHWACAMSLVFSLAGQLVSVS